MGHRGGINHPFPPWEQHCEWFCFKVMTSESNFFIHWITLGTLPKTVRYLWFLTVPTVAFTVNEPHLVTWEHWRDPCVHEPQYHSLKLNDAFRKTLIKAAKKNSKTIHYESQVQSNRSAGGAWWWVNSKWEPHQSLSIAAYSVSIKQIKSNWKFKKQKQKKPCSTTRFSQKVYKGDFLQIQSYI